MATKYWYKALNSGDNWSTVGNWYFGSGGTGGTAGLPTAVDDVIFDAASTTNATVTIITTAAVCNSLDCTNFKGTLTGSTVGLNITNTITRGATASTPLFAWGTGMTAAFSGTVTFGGTGGGGLIYCNGKTFQGPVTFNNAAATFTFKDAFKTISTALVTQTAGAIVANDAIVEFGLFTSTGTGLKTFSCTNLYLIGTGPLYALGTGSTNLTSTITNIYVNNATTTPKTLLFNTQFGSNTLLDLGGSGNISIALGATYQPNVTVSNTGGTASVFNITAATTIKSLVFTQPVTWSNAAITTTIGGNMTLVGGLNITATPSLVFSANATITTAGKSLVTGTLTTNASTTTTIVGVLGSDANITFNSTVNTSSNVSTTGTLTITGISNLSGSLVSAGVLTISGANADLNTVASSTVSCTGLTTLSAGGAVAYAGVFTSGSITITSGSFTGTAGVAGDLTCNGVLTITLGSINTGGASLRTSSITQTGTGIKSITVTGAGSGLYLTGTSALFTNSAGTSTNLATVITNIYVTEASTTAKSLIFDTQFGSTNLSFNGSGNMTFTPGTSKLPNVIINNPAPASVFNIAATGTIQSLVFNTSITWNNTTAGVTLTINGSSLDLSGITLTANPSLVFPNPVTINLTGKILATGALTTSSTATFVGTGITSNAAVTLNGTTGVPGNISTGTAALTIGGACTFTGTSITAGALNINGTAASILQSTGSLFSVAGSGALTITQGSLNTNGGNLTVSSITSSGAASKTIGVTGPGGLYLTGTSPLYTAGTGLVTTIDNIYVTNTSAAVKSLIFDTQFGSTNLELGGSGSINFTPGTFKQPNVTVTNTGGSTSIFNIAATGTIRNLIFATGVAVTWGNTAGLTLTLVGNTFTLVATLTISANPSLVFSNLVAITLAGESLLTGSLTTNSTATFDGGITSNAAVTLNGTTTVPGNISTGTSTLTIGGACTITGNSVSAGAIAINGAAASIIQSTSSLFSVTGSGVFTITQGSLNTNGGTLSVASILQVGTSNKSITVSNLYLTGTSSLFTNSGGASTNLTTAITNIYVSNATTTAKSLVFDTQFGSTNLELGGSGSISFSPGTFKQPNVTVTNTGGAASIFDISSSGTISSLIFTTSVTWNNTLSVTLTVNGNALNLSGISFGVNGHSSLVFPNNVAITLGGKSLVIGTLTTSANATFDGALVSNAAVTLNGTTTVPGNINTGTAILTIGGACNPSGSIISAGTLNVAGATASLNTVPGSAINCGGVTTLSSGGAVAYAGTFTSNSITITSGSFTGSTGSVGNLTCSGVLTITQGSINTNGGNLLAASITSSGTSPKSITVPSLSLTGTSTLYTAGTGLTTSITNIYVTNATTTAKTLVFDTQFGSTNLELGGSGSISFSPGTTKIPSVTVTNTGGTASIFNIASTGTISSLIFTTAVTWNNTLSVILTLNGNTFTLVSGIVFGANGHSSLVFINNVSITLAGLSLKTGTLTTSANATFDTGIISNAAVSLNGTTSVPGDINVGTAALTIGGACTFTGTSITAGALNINGAAASIIQSTSSLFSVTGSGVFTITQGSLNTNGGTLSVASITSSGSNAKSITAPILYLTGTGTLYTAGTGLTTTIPNIYVTTTTGLSRALTFDNQFGSTDLELGGAGAGGITLNAGTFFKPNILISSTGNPTFSIFATSTIGNLIFSDLAVVTWTNGPIVVTSTGSLFTIVNGVTITLTPFLVFNNDVTITTAGKIFVNGTLTTNGTTTINGVFNINNSVTLNGTGLQIVNFSDTFTITTGSLIVSGAISYFPSTLSAPAITINSGTISTVGNISCGGTTTISGNGKLEPGADFTADAITINSGSIESSGALSPIFTCSTVFTLVSGTITNNTYELSKTYIGSVTTSGSGSKSINLSNLYLQGTGTLLTSAGTTNLSSAITNIYVTDTSITAKTLAFANGFGSTNAYLSGTLITFGGGTELVPNVYVQNTTGSTVSFQTGILTTLTFSAGTNVRWANAAGQTVTIQGDLTLTGTMNISVTIPSLIVTTGNITLAGRTLLTGSLTIDGGYVYMLDNLNSTAIAVTVRNDANFTTKGFITTGLLSVLGSSGSTINTTGSAFSIGTLAMQTGAINFNSSSHICTGDATVSIGANILNSVDAQKTLTISGTLTISAGASLDITTAGNVVGLTTLTGGSTLNVGFPGFVFSAVTITSGYVTSGNSSNYVCTGVTTLTAGDFGDSGDYYTGSLTIGGTSQTKNMYVTNLYFTGNGILYTQGASVILSTGPDNIRVIESTSAAKTLTLTAQFPLTTNIPIYLGGTGSGSITVTPATTSLPDITVTNTGGANIALAGAGTQIITSLTFANTSNAKWANGAMSLTIQSNLILSSNSGMTVTSSPTLIFNVGSSAIVLYGKSLTSPMSISAGAYVSTGTDFSSTSTVTVTDGTLDIVGNNFTVTGAVTIAANGSMRAIDSNATVNLGSLAVTGYYTQYIGNLICQGAFSVPGNITIGGSFSRAVNVTCQTFSGTTVNCNIRFFPGCTLTLTGTGTVFTVAATANAVSIDGIIRITDTSVSAVTFAGGNWSYNELIFDRGTSTGSNTLTGSNTFINFRDRGTAGHSLIFPSGGTTTIGNFDVQGSPGNSIALVRSSTTATLLTKSPAGLVLCDWITVTNVPVSETNTWYSGPNSTVTTSLNWNTGGASGSPRKLGIGGVG